MTELELEIRDALIRLADRELPEDEVARLTADWTPSPRFRRKLARLTRRAAAKPVRKELFRAAVVALLAGSLILIPTAQAGQTTQIYRQEAGGQVVYRFQSLLPQFSVPDAGQWEISALPEGYEETKREDGAASSRVYYQNGDGKRISLTVGTVHSGARIEMDRLNHRIERVLVGSTDAEYYHGQRETDWDYLFWIREQEDGKRYFLLAGTVDQSELLQAAERVVPVEKGESRP